MRHACPNPECQWSDPSRIPKDEPWYGSYGFYTTKQYGRVPRYICRRCRRTFSLRTGGSYWHLRDDSCDVGAICTKWLKGETVAELSLEYGISRQMVTTRLRKVMHRDGRPGDASP